MSALQQEFDRGDRFLVGVELVSTRGTVNETRVGRTLAFAHDLAGCRRIDWVSITDNAGGNPMLAPAALGGHLRDAGREVVIHLSCKDGNRNALESEAWHLASEGFHNLLALSGDCSGAGIAGGAKPVFDIDSVGLLTLLGRMNAGLDVTRPGARRLTRLAPTRFFSGCVVTNFKLRENEVVPQLLKLEKKLACGARWVVNQIGYDARKMSELTAWLRRRGLGHVPLVGNVYVLNPAVARLFRQGKIPGVVVADELAAECERRAASPDGGRAYFLELAARQMAVYRGLGYRGVYLGGIHTLTEVEQVLDRESAFAPGDWREFARGLRYSRPGEYFCFAEDPVSGLADPERPAPGAAAPAAKNVTIGYRFAQFAHATLFTPGTPAWKLGARLCAGARHPDQGPWALRAAERLGKAVLFGCKDCGDCSLPDIAFLCPESACAKNQRNGPCGGTRDGRCEAGDFECIWARAYDRLKAEGRADELLAHAPVLQDQHLRGTSSWANTWLGCDHLARKPAPPLSSAPPPAPAPGGAAPRSVP
ncbi:MAG: methylenetetrahydrofolate reductase C-terminal domain-containing protein [Opitutae bacterium]|nr:methylenetetrahydrofolate reductase C-terminal domain-containing protein [Opitutae bacterium]